MLLFVMLEPAKRELVHLIVFCFENSSVNVSSFIWGAVFFVVLLLWWK